MNLELLVLIIDFHAIPLQADPLSVLNVRHGHHGTELLLDPDGLTYIDDAVRLPANHLLLAVLL